MISTIAVFVYVAAVAAMALMWVTAQEPEIRPSVREETHGAAHDPYIICGQGYHDQEDKITMTRAIELTAGAMYVHISGSVYKCLRTTADGCAVLMDINSGTLLTVRSVRAYQDGKIDYQIVECVRLAGAAV